MSFEEQIMSKDKYMRVFSPHVYYPSNIFCNLHGLKIGEYHSDAPQYLLGNIQVHLMHLDPLCMGENIYWILSLIAF